MRIYFALHLLQTIITLAYNYSAVAEFVDTSNLN